MEAGEKALSDLSKKASLEQFEDLYEKHQDHVARQEMERELFGQVLRDEDLQDELDQLDAMIMEEQLVDAG